MNQGQIFISGEIGVDVNLIDVVRQVKAQPSATEFLVKIDSIGGFVDVGDDIFNYLKNLVQPVTTLAIRAYSIASKIFMAGSTRLVHQDSTDVIMIHLPWMEVAGSHGVISDHLKGLKNVEDGLVKFYAEALEIDENTVLSLLKNETYLSASQALEMGFASAIQPKLQAVAKYNNRDKDKENLMSKIESKIEKIYNKLFGIKNSLVLQDATGIEVTFPDLAEGDTVETDAKVQVDGIDATGEFLMPDGSTIVAENGIVKEVKPAVETEETEDETVAVEGDESEKDALIEELKAEIEALKAELEKGKSDEAETENKMVAVMAKMIEKSDELESKYLALAKQVGSDFNPKSEKENSTNIKASETSKSRAWQILNS